jgi:hypothetical protein
VSSGVARPPSIMPAEISARLPVPEEEFTYMRAPPARPVFLPELRAGVPAACGAESMFAGLVHSAELWGEATRWACDVRRQSADGPPTDPASEWAGLSGALSDWAAVRGAGAARAAR